MPRLRRSNRLHRRVLWLYSSADAVRLVGDITPQGVANQIYLRNQVRHVVRILRSVLCFGRERHGVDCSYI